MIKLPDFRRLLKIAAQRLAAARRFAFPPDPSESESAPSEADMTARLFQQTRRLVLRITPRMLDALAGAYHRQRPGLGLAFAESRPYEPGDDVRFLDVNATARMGRPFVRSYLEERSLAVWIVFDASQAMTFGPPQRTRRDAAVAAGLLLAAVAIRQGDRVGACWIQDGLSLRIPPRNGRKQLWTIASHCSAWLNSNPQTDLSFPSHADSVRAGLIPRAPIANWKSVHDALRTERRGALVVMFSGFEDCGPDALWSAMTHRHNILTIRVSDPREDLIADVGKIAFVRDDPATHSFERFTVDTGSRAVRQAYRTAAMEERLSFNRWRQNRMITAHELSTTDDPLRFWQNAFPSTHPQRRPTSTRQIQS